MATEFFDIVRRDHVATVSFDRPPVNALTDAVFAEILEIFSTVAEDWETRVVVFTSRPGRIKKIVTNDLPRPRDPFAPDSEALRRELTSLLKDEVDRAFAEQEDLAVSA